ncbi:MAG TPA: periplasmic heavy metal sensor [Thermoanaerobaculaceae bacterium]|nr:periplasmic heavy metal sensor [Thermoanaerobaculaceae bacterium]HRS17630.1 periplasmic heavy metal sensor [Thermoanaerobaculaceae bacterium]
MTRQATVWTLAGLLLLVAAGAWAQGPALPPGKWWERPRVAQELGLTAEQKQKLEGASLESARVMIDLKAAVEKAELDLKAVGDADTLDPRAAREAFAALQQARMRLESERFELLIKVRQVLTREQWVRLRELTREALRERIEERPEGARPLPNRPLRRRF